MDSVYWWDVLKKNCVLKCESSRTIGQLSYTCLAMSAAESFGENRNSFVFPLTKMSLKLIWNTNNSAIRSPVSIHPTLPQHPHEMAFATPFSLCSVSYFRVSYQNRAWTNVSLLKQCINSYFTAGKERCAYVRKICTFLQNKKKLASQFHDPCIFIYTNMLMIYVLTTNKIVEFSSYHV